MTAPDAGRDRWWLRSIGYEVYVRSFADADGDGVGDLAGLRSRLDHLAGLGVDLLWLTPIYPSPQRDFGYDISDYCDIDPRFGDLAEFDALLADAHARGMRVIVDIVPNHTSDQHRWFLAARTGTESRFRDYYHWADPAPGGGPPNNWVSMFGGPAWTLDEASGQYYLHLFLPEQPDLNWSNLAVLAEFDATLRFWLDRGVDGFRIDVAHALVKDEKYRSNPELYPWDPAADRWRQWNGFEHRHDILQPGLLDVYRRWRAITSSYGALLLGETYVLDAAELDFMLPGDGLDAGFWFGLMHVTWDADEIRAGIRGPLGAGRAAVGWAIASHDEPRPVTRFGGGQRGRDRALALATLLFGLPGIPFLFQGEELGLADGVVPPEFQQDPIGSSRDGCRTPMPWEPDAPNLGFSAGTPWLPMGGRVAADTAAVQAATPGSWLARYRDLVAWRRGLPDLGGADVEWLDRGTGPVIAYRRGPVVVAANLADTPVTAALPAGAVRFTHGVVSAADAGLRLGPAAAVALEVDR
jgi:alpha-glucosidase